MKRKEYRDPIKNLILPQVRSSFFLFTKASLKKKFFFAYKKNDLKINARIEYSVKILINYARFFIYVL